MRFSKLKPAARRRMFEGLLPEIRRVAWDMGYAVGVHGTLTRDMDLIGVPWIDTAAPEIELARAIAAAIGGLLHEYATKKPHGRLAWVIYPTFHDVDERHYAVGYIDLSVTPRRRA